jgi:hypothetical protein
MRTEIYIENYLLDLTEDIETEFTYTIDDIQDFGSKNTSYSKTIRIAGNGNNNEIFGFIFDLNNANTSVDDQPNVGFNFNASKYAQCRIFVDGMQIFKGSLRILEIVREGEVLQYECSVVGDLGGFISALGNKKLTDNTEATDNLDFSAYNVAWNWTNITNSWDNINGSGCYFPLVDYGAVSSTASGRIKKDFDFKAFRPAFYVKEILNKIKDASGYTWDFPLLDTALFNRLVIPNNQRLVNKISNVAFNSNFNVTLSTAQFLPLSVTTAGSFTGSNPITYTGSGTQVDITCRPVVQVKSPIPILATFYLYKGSTLLKQEEVYVTNNTTTYYINLDVNNIDLATSNQLSVQISTNVTQYQLFGGSFKLETSLANEVAVAYDEVLDLNFCLPRGIFQRDFFLSICKMFNLYVYDDPVDEKKIIIKPYIDFYSGSIQDWTLKVDRSKAWSIKPMSEIKARYYQFKYKPDNDYYAENYRKKFNEGYGDYIFDTEFDFVKDTESTELIFAGSVLYQLNGTDKVFPSIYKLSSSGTTEDNMDSVIRILQAKKITGRTSYYIKNAGTNVGSALTAYGYAGHLDDPFTPTNDLNFGAPREIYFGATSYPTTNLFNAYYSEYMAEITDKDSKLLTCNILLNTFDIKDLDFAKYIYIDNVLYRINLVESYNPIDYTTTKVELLKVIDK